MSVRVTFLAEVAPAKVGEAPRPIVLTPRTALRRGADAWIVLDGKLARRKLEVGRERGDEVVVTSGLTGEKALVVGPEAAFRGGAVRSASCRQRLDSAGRLLDYRGPVVSMVARIFLALLLILQSLPLLALAADGHCHGGRTGSDHCPFHAAAPVREGDHCGRKPAEHDHHAAAKTPSEGGVRSACSCQHGPAAGAVRGDPYVEPVLLSLDRSDLPPTPMPASNRLILEAESTPPTPPPRILSV